VVWCPEYRRKVIVGPVEKRLKEIVKEVASQINVEIIEMETMPDHIHLLLEVAPQFGIHRAVKRIKGQSSRVPRSEFKHLTTKLPTLWTNTVAILFQRLVMLPYRLLKRLLKINQQIKGSELMRTVKIKLAPTIEQEKNLTSISKTCIKTVNEIVTSMVEAEKMLELSSKDVDALMPSSVKNQAIRDAKSVYRKIKETGDSSHSQETGLSLEQPKLYRQGKRTWFSCFD
jgi:hypothetical protein